MAMIYRENKQFYYQYDQGTNMCISVSSSVFKGTQFDGYEAGLIGYHDKWIGDGGKHDNENTFMKSTKPLEADLFKKQFSLLMCKLGLSIDGISFYYSPKHK